MPELAAPERFGASAPRMMIVNVPQGSDASDPFEVRVFRTTEPYIWRVRSVAVHGRVTGSMGTARVGLSFNISAAAGEPWTNNANDSGVNATSPVDVNFGDNFAYTWSTEIGDNYTGTSTQWGKTAMLGLPMVWLPPVTDIVLEASGSGGFDGSFITRDGYMMIEYLEQETAGVEPDLASVYLLPVNQ